MTKEQYDKFRHDKEMYHVLYMDLLNASGWAGVLPNGNLVDRRYYPEAFPVQKNSMFGVAEPRELPKI